MEKIRVVCGGIVEKDGKVLLVQEKKESAYKKWNFPAGRVKPGEDIPSTVIREVKEESGFDVEPIDLVGIYQSKESEYHIIAFVFRTKVVGGDLKIDKKEHFSTAWFTKQEFKEMEKEGKLRDKGMVEIIEDYFDGKSYDHKELIKKNFN